MCQIFGVFRNMKLAIYPGIKVTWIFCLCTDGKKVACV